MATPSDNGGHGWQTMNFTLFIAFLIFSMRTCQLYYYSLQAKS